MTPKSPTKKINWFSAWASPRIQHKCVLTHGE
jgi:hypothetical protein